jgi:hypothetical protein
VVSRVVSGAGMTRPLTRRMNPILGFREQEPHASIETRGSLMERTALVVTAAARRWRWLVTRAPVVAAGASSGVRSGERHPDTKNDAGKKTCKELSLAQFEHAAHLPSAVRARALAGYAGRRNGRRELFLRRQLRATSERRVFQ